MQRGQTFHLPTMLRDDTHNLEVSSTRADLSAAWIVKQTSSVLAVQGQARPPLHASHHAWLPTPTPCAWTRKPGLSMQQALAHDDDSANQYGGWIAAHLSKPRTQVGSTIADCLQRKKQSLGRNPGSARKGQATWTMCQ